ncbi:MAG: MFS transporter [Candidatus Fibromonas sp.]|jgi:MFS family permease|nr:MFS transporter [Candidatus Fibromonas sp.]
MENRKSVVLFTLCLTSFLVPYMGSSLNLALPQIAAAFNLDAKKLGWINSAFLIATAIFQIPFAKVADLNGRKKVFLYGVALFGISSVACAFSWNFASLIIFRIFAGLGAAMIFGTNLAILSATFEHNERGKAMGTLSSVVYMSLAVGPFLGGISTHYLGWESVFYIPGIVLIAQAFSIPFFIKQEWVEQSSRHFDKSGSLLYGLALFCLIFGFSELPGLNAVVLVFVGILLIFLFYNYEKNKNEPLFQVRLFESNRVFTCSALAAFFSYAATMAVFFMVSLYLQFVRGFDARAAGLILISSAVVQSIAAFYAGRLADKFEPSKIAMLGMGLNVIGLLGLIFTGMETSIFVIIAMLLFLGLGFGLFSSPNTKVIMGSVKRKHISQASATVGTMRLAGQAFSMGIAMMSISLFIGDSQITPDKFENFMQTWKFTFAICAILCIAGTYASSVNSIFIPNAKSQNQKKEV